MLIDWLYELLLILFSSSKLDKDDILQYIYFKQYHTHHSSRTTHQTASYTNHIVRSGKFGSASQIPNSHSCKVI